MKKPKICMITDSLFGSGGIATAVRELSCNLALKGYEVDMVTRDVKCKDPEKLLKIVNVTSAKRPFALWDISEASFQTSKVIDGLLSDYDIIHAHGPIAIARLFSKKYTDIPWIITVHGTFQKELTWLKSYPKVDANMLRYWLGTHFFTVFEQWLYNSLSSRAHFIAVAQQTKDDLTKMGINGNRVYVVPNGVNTGLYRPMPVDESRKKTQIENLVGPDAKVVLSVNYIEPRKGMHILLKAFHMVLKKIQNAHCIIVGDSSLKGYREYLMRLVSDLGLNKNVHFTGFVDDEILPHFFASCDIFALPSLAEGAPLVIPMAMATRKPVIATTACAAEEYLEPKCTTMPGNCEELAEKLIYYLVNEEEAANLADRLYANAVENLAWDKIAEKTVSAYQSELQD
jgi:glycosyltransferase involved in cell wall biosynthesis